ncbi:hypothetical protein D9V37_05675 [Nocardioides mangrovicus]|uniref:Uncharacterized protein n=1 Tax=Nocardioides mangrovicus TaxID=2478913 RepID=A0A3L8P6H2_9ACTN|nr:hypothetical protein [Nocardioides mangrovicus]RLV50209.1 hypothetical protein D9V37_05675 [Nocardioides mangrovicus]
MRFEGRIAGVGTTSGVRLVVGRWDQSPFGAFTDVMVAHDQRTLLAPTQEVADFVASTYRFDEVVVGEVRVEGWHVTAPGLDLELEVGRRTRLGRLLVGAGTLGSMFGGFTTAPWWTVVTDPVARLTMRGVRTRGTAGQGRREYYGATDLHRVDAVRGTWRGADLGDLAEVWPEPGFGFGSTPRRPGVTRLVTTVLGSGSDHPEL